MACREKGRPKDQASKLASPDSFIIVPEDRILVTGAAGFIGSRVVESLVDRGFRNVVCLARPSSDLARLELTSRADREGRASRCFEATSSLAQIAKPQAKVLR
jgi:nucleoside-diphosphate-sugar epimerase